MLLLKDKHSADVFEVCPRAETPLVDDTVRVDEGRLGEVTPLVVATLRAPHARQIPYPPCLISPHPLLADMILKNTTKIRLADFLPGVEKVCNSSLHSP